MKREVNDNKYKWYFIYDKTLDQGKVPSCKKVQNESSLLNIIKINGHLIKSIAIFIW